MTNSNFDQGFKNRKQVLGAVHVEKSWENADELNKPMQELVTEYCWGAVWGDETLDYKTRSMLNIAMLTVLSQHHELSVHVRGAITNGVSHEEIAAIIRQAAVYGGVPCGLAAMRVASDVIKSV
ncbi:gamma carboxymuconolactone decarboxylase [Acinetobacter sp. ANC 4558]|uniref:carboxymuconolactone decarboxylase family protein n=1 Tax=Acinetobacter sp. ANC 4558 TaxID=1977876 RepID=UPI000A34A952|nr:carboxymuconolactone decarboxylase family protein [Acinetobacter sp. ANC 4558]OTG87087.1 gamma carboxymuconolactone decarboxylase [Acinetobacter sp. ANC 4558]